MILKRKSLKSELLWEAVSLLTKGFKAMPINFIQGGKIMDHLYTHRN